MNFDNVKSIVDNRVCEPEDTEKQAANLAKRAVEQEENQKQPKKDTLTDMQKLANAKNQVSAMMSKAKQQNPDEESKAGRPKGSKNKKTTASKKGPGRPPKKEDDKKRGPGRPPKKDKEEK